MPRKARTTRSKPATFVIVHGAWTGSWSWQRAIDRLAAKGHKVFAPALSGLGERSHLARSGINLTTHIDDIANEIRWKDLDQIVLVGHSYGGFVISGMGGQQSHCAAQGHVHGTTARHGCVPASATQDLHSCLPLGGLLSLMRASIPTGCLRNRVWA
jgi:hypothetical protein